MPPTLSKPPFEFDAGSLCLNFANTVWERPGYLTAHPEPPHELLESYADLVAWARAGGIIAEQYLNRLETEARAEEEAAHRALVSAKSLREEVFRACLHLALQRGPMDLQLDAINARLAQSPPQKIQYVPLPPVTSSDSDRIYSPFLLAERDRGDLHYIEFIVLRDLVKVLTTSPIDRLRVCAAEDCGWLFLDTSKNGKRRWCSMSDCGNRAKASRFQSRKKGSDQPD